MHPERLTFGALTLHMTSRWQRCPWTRLPPAQLALPGTALYHLGAKMLENLPCLSFRASLLISTCPEMSRNSQARRLKRPELYTHGFQELLNAWIVETPIGQRWGQLAFYTGPSRVHHRAWRRSPREQPAMMRRFSGVTVGGHIGLPLHTAGSRVCLGIQAIFCGSVTY